MTGLLATSTFAQNVRPQPILPETLRWIERPGGLLLQAAWVLGAESSLEPYLIRVQLAAGGRIPPHTHPDARYTTVLSGTLYVGFGTAFDESAGVAIPTGAVYVAPAGVPHFLEAWDGAVVYQEAGVGPTGTVWVKP
ncbi:MAG: cupin domain-containing protein [Candidatus Competibacteraceae bacterium]|nr:cupin domain-containing protein [Candidatus Competibacteraceae bacterium]MCP5124887.1 cupin domain-containing protein [Gammaproteobacteria bacterium]